MIESEIERGVFVNRDEAERTTVADLLARYLRDVSPTKRSGKSDKGRVKTLTKRIGAYKLSILVSPHLVAYRDARLRSVSAQTVIHELNLLNRVLTLATREWGIVLPGGVPKVIKPRAPQGRDRRVRAVSDSFSIGTTYLIELEQFMHTNLQASADAAAEQAAVPRGNSLTATVPSPPEGPRKRPLSHLKHGIPPTHNKQENPMYMKKSMRDHNGRELLSFLR